MSFKSSLLAKYKVVADEMMDAIHEDYGRWEMKLAYLKDTNRKHMLSEKLKLISGK